MIGYYWVQLSISKINCSKKSNENLQFFKEFLDYDISRVFNFSIKEDKSFSLIYVSSV